MKCSARRVETAVAIKASAEGQRGAPVRSRKTLIDVGDQALEIVRGYIKCDDLTVGGIMGDWAAETDHMQYALGWEQQGFERIPLS